jgi:hypothetical protein
VTPAELAEVLRAAHPDADPLGIATDRIAAWSQQAAGVRPDDHMLAATVVAWAELVA